MNDVERFAAAVIEGSPLEAHARIWGLERVPGETDEALGTRLEAVRTPPLPRPLRMNEAYCHLCCKFFELKNYTEHHEKCRRNIRKSKEKNGETN